MSAAVRPFDVWRIGAGDPTLDRDRVAVELPLEVRLHSEPFAVIMRTPGDDRHLVLGFLLTESVLNSVDDVERIDADDVENVVNVWLRPEKHAAATRALGERRQVTMNSSCGMCGRRSLESLSIGAAPFPSDWRVREETVRALPAALGAVQSAFSETGGLHAAGLFDLEGRLIAGAEDVGRHNAVDKLLGRMLVEKRLPADRAMLVVSGRSSFEIVQKAWFGGIRLIAAVSAPSSLAVDLAREAGITLLGFVREGRFNVYAHPERLDLADIVDERIEH
jgi:FdhD protein